ncbi:MAG TPA: DUF4190 domain-containing protein [Roseiflexaceae bacterium]|nr:DUF4190 domain-containing protein [Roseiflexaceae bacterium]
MKCSFCQASLEANTAFCPNCGAAVVPSSAGAKTSLIGSERTSDDSPTVAIPSQSSQSSQSPFSLPSQQPVVTQSYQPPGLSQPQQPPSAPYAYGVPDMGVPLPNSTAAIVSLVFGILSWVALPFIGSIVAIIAGHIGRREVAQSNGRLGGGGLALAGLILGYLQVALFALAICAFIGLVILGAAVES